MAFVAWSDEEGLTAAENDDDPDHSVPLRLRSYVEKRMKDNTLDPVGYAKYLNPDLTDKDSAFLSLQAAVEWVKSRSSRLTSGAKKHATEAFKRLAKYPWDDPMGPWATFWEKVANKQHAKLQRLKRNLQGEIELTSRSGLALEKTLRKVNKAKAKRKRGTSPAQAVADEDEEVTTPTKKRTSALTPFLHTPMKPQLKTSTKFETAIEIVFLFRASRHDPLEAQLSYVEQMNNIYDVSCVPSSVQEMMTKLSAEPIASAPGVLLSSDNQEDKHLHVARSVIFDFWAMTRHMSGNVLVPGRERKHLIEQVSPLFKHMEHTFHNIAFDWIERPANSTKSLRQMCEGKRQTFAVDVLGIAAADSSEITYVEHSGLDTDKAETMKHANDDILKLINEAIDGAKFRLCRYLDALAEQASDVKSFALQIIGQRMTLFSLSLVGENKYLAMECKSACLPSSWAEADLFEEVFDLAFFLLEQVDEQQQMMAKLRSQLRRGKQSAAGPTVREWLQLSPSII